jgi:pantetheine-phosphate adenylyltransferase
MSDLKNQAIASRLVKEIARLGGDISKFVTKDVKNALIKKIR